MITGSDASKPKKQRVEVSDHDFEEDVLETLVGLAAAGTTRGQLKKMARVAYSAIFVKNWISRLVTSSPK